ncbi:MAG: NAD(P)-dependent glycerol-3-phosphate dehydrogenase [Acidobacteria bacterium]|nr:NAD(P)-dependent glycerol-3-phosphate dehydrogenase [Acidobacteriota bacterium]
MVIREIAILGSGSWGTALAVHLARIGHTVRVWSIEAPIVAEMRERRANAVYLPDIVLPPEVLPTTDLAAAVNGVSMVVLAVPSHVMRSVVRAVQPQLGRDTILVSVAKGLELDTLDRMSQVLHQETLGTHPVVVVSGPSFAIEVARELPTAVSVASDDLAAAGRVQEEFRGKFFRLYTTTDVAGVEIGGALKNVIAIAAGVAEGLGLGHNAQAALITRGLVEISRLAIAEGGRRETLAGLTGLGDLILTCTGPYSRNRHVGIELAHGRPLEGILAGMKMVAEGVKTTGAALALGARHGVELPITAQMAAVIAGDTTPADALAELMLRPQRIEADAG